MAGVSARLKGRDRQVRRLILNVADWARREENVEAVALVGSYASGTRGMASDVDLIILSARFDQLAEELSWFERLRPGQQAHSLTGVGSVA
jgi:predicted nucleotidyltransferase